MHSLWSIVTCTVLLKVATLKYIFISSELISFLKKAVIILTVFYQFDMQILAGFFGIMTNSVVNRYFQSLCNNLNKLNNHKW